MPNIKAGVHFPSKMPINCILTKNIHFGESDSWVQIAISTKTNPDILIGDLAIHFLKDCDKQIEIGFTLSPQAQNKGFAKKQ